MPSLIAGAARVEITPPLGLLQAGYASRTTPAVGVHDPLFATVLYVSDGRTEAALVTADLIGFSAEGTARIREACAETSGVPATSILVAGSHTHGGPKTALDRSGSGDARKDAYSANVVYQVAGALAEAKRKAAPARMGCGRQDCGFAMNRRERRPDGTVVLGVNPEGPTAPYTDVIRLDRADTGEPLAVLLSYACHGTTLGGDNLLYTADYPGRAKRVVEQLLPPAVALFAAGCSGDINPHPRGTFEWCERHGRILGCAAAQAALEIEEMREDVSVAVARREFALPLEAIPSLEEARDRLATAEAAVEAEVAAARQAAGGKEVDRDTVVNWFTAAALRGAKELVAALEAGETEFGIPCEAQAIALGECALVGVPGEVFVRIGLEIAERSPFARTLAVSHANGAPGYVPTADQVAIGGYEIAQARARRYGVPIRPDADRTMIEAALAALEECRGLAR